VRVVVLRGAGGHFCAGADLKDMAGARMRAMQAQGSGTGPIAEVNAEFGELCVAYARTPLAVVAVLEGTVMGGGFGLACVADVAIASETANFRLPETSLGVGARADRALSGRASGLFAGQAAGGHRWAAGRRPPRCAWGWCMKLLQAVAIDGALEQSAGRYSGLCTRRAGRYQGPDGPSPIARAARPGAAAAAIFSHAAQGPEGMEGMTAFMQKRKPGNGHCHDFF
jgi:isohexenylglutaconyl-CoA hydratase